MPLVVEKRCNSVKLSIEDKEFKNKSKKKYVHYYDQDKVTIELLDSTCPNTEPAEAIFDRRILGSSDREICTNGYIQKPPSLGNDP